MDFLNTPEKRDRRMIHLPMGRFGEAVELAKGALFRESNFVIANVLSLTICGFIVASDDSSYMTVRSTAAVISCVLTSDTIHRVRTSKLMEVCLRHMSPR